MDEARERRKRNNERGLGSWREADRGMDRETARASTEQGKWKSYYSLGVDEAIWLAMGSTLLQKVQILASC